MAYHLFGMKASRRLHSMVSKLLFSSVAFLLITTCPAQGQQPFKLDHFLCYLVQPTQFQGSKGLSYIDQFNVQPPKPFALKARESFCNPVEKDKEPIINRLAHLTGYTYFFPPGVAVRPLNIPVNVSNQFGQSQRYIVLLPIKFLVPSGKLEVAGEQSTISPPDIPQGLDHFACYTVKAERPFEKHPVTLRDQFGELRSMVLDPSFLCNPAEKRIEDKPTGHMINNRDHLMCYALEPQQFKARKISIHNQFEKKLIEAARPSVLCVPSTKERLKE